ncbi:MAG: 30S ribosomal protein S20 [bacterium]|nr:30S ribosomal protein S20 [bacterium]
MPVKVSAIKALKVAKRRASENERARANLKRAIKAATLGGKDKTDRTKKAQSLIDKAVKVHLIHRHKAARLVSRLARKPL